LQRCGLQIAFDRRVPKQAAKAPELPPPSPLLIFAATPGSFIPGLDSCPLSGGALLEDPSKELQELQQAGLRVVGEGEIFLWRQLAAARQPSPSCEFFSQPGAGRGMAEAMTVTGFSVTANLLPRASSYRSRGRGGERLRPFWSACRLTGQPTAGIMGRSE